MESKVLIIGGSGCVGLETTRWLMENSDADLVGLSRAQKVIQPMCGIQYETCDIMNLEGLVEIMERHQISHILHAAGLRTSACEQNPLQAVEINVRGTAHVFEAARIVGSVRKIVYTSSAAVYSVPGDGSFVSEDSEVYPLNAYTASKIAAENIVQFYAKKFAIPTVVLRPQIIYGPDRKDGSTADVSRAIEHSLRGEPFTIGFSGCYGFHFSKDVGMFHGLCLLQEKQQIYRVFNLPGESLDITRICKHLNSLSGRELITYRDSPYPFAKGLEDSAYRKEYADCKIGVTRLSRAVMSWWQ